MYVYIIVQWNLAIKRPDITKPSYNKATLLAPALHTSLFLYPDTMRKPLQGNPMIPRSSLQRGPTVQPGLS